MDARRSRGRRDEGVITGPSINLGASQPVSHAIMFYVLAFAAMALFAPCVLVPIWRDVQKLGGDERTMAGAVAQLRQQIERNQERIEALKVDPQVIERAKQRARFGIGRQAVRERPGEQPLEHLGG